MTATLFGFHDAYFYQGRSWQLSSLLEKLCRVLVGRSHSASVHLAAVLPFSGGGGDLGQVWGGCQHLYAQKLGYLQAHGGEMMLGARSLLGKAQGPV